MQRYEPNTPRVTLGLAAIAMTAIVLSVLVILPAEMDAAAGPDAWADVSPPLAQTTARDSDVQAPRKPAPDALRCTDIKSEHSPAG